MERTIYNGQTKKFIPKKSSASSDHFFEQYLTSSTLINEPTSLCFYESRRTEKKANKLELNDSEVNVFCVPETPRPSVDKKQNPLKKAYSMDFSKMGVATFKI